MYYDFRVPIPDAKGKIYPQERNGVTYVQFEYARVYNPDKKYNTPKRPILFQHASLQGWLFWEMAHRT